MNIWFFILNIVLTGTVIGLGIYFKSYLIKKADFQATKENIEALIDQLKLTTEATKEIEAKFTNGAWVEQQRWSVRKSFYLDAVSLLHRLDQDFKKSLKIYKSSMGDLTEDQQIDAAKQESIIDKRISANSKSLEDILHSTGVLFLEQHIVDTINKYINAEDDRCDPLIFLLENSDNYHVGSELNAEIHSYSSYLCNQSEQCEEAYNKLVAAAKADLRIAWASQ